MKFKKGWFKMKVKQSRKNKPMQRKRFSWRVAAETKAKTGCPSCPAGTGAAFA